MSRSKPCSWCRKRQLNLSAVDRVLTCLGAAFSPPKMSQLSTRQNSKRARGLCVEPFCRNFTYGRTRCNTCKSADYARRNPLRIKFLNLKKSAKRRAIDFTLQFEEFIGLVAGTEYVLFQDLGPDSLTIDRRDETGGYTPDNLQLKSNADNARKAALFRKSYVPFFHGGGCMEPF